MAAPKKSKITPAATPAKAPTPIAAAIPAAPVERSEIKGLGKPKAPVATPVITQDDIAKRAFEIYASRGYAPGDQDADWHEAERQLKAGL